jgi:hypothetical protein
MDRQVKERKEQAAQCYLVLDHQHQLAWARLKVVMIVSDPSRLFGGLNGNPLSCIPRALHSPLIPLASCHLLVVQFLFLSLFLLLSSSLRFLHTPHTIPPRAVFLCYLNELTGYQMNPTRLEDQTRVPGNLLPTGFDHNGPSTEEISLVYGWMCPSRPKVVT